MEYLIGAGAVLESGESGSITPATLHAHVDAALVRDVAAAAVDFEGTTPAAIHRLLVLVQGWDASRFRRSVSEPLQAKRECSLADVLARLAQAAGTRTVHVFAHWLPDERTCSELAAGGIQVVAHPLESIEAASVVTGQRCRRWQAA